MCICSAASGQHTAGHGWAQRGGDFGRRCCSQRVRDSRGTDANGPAVRNLRIRCVLRCSFGYLSGWMQGQGEQTPSLVQVVEAKPTLRQLPASGGSGTAFLWSTTSSAARSTYHKSHSPFTIHCITLSMSRAGLGSGPPQASNSRLLSPQTNKITKKGKL